MGFWGSRGFHVGGVGRDAWNTSSTSTVASRTVSWVESESGEPVEENDVKGKLEKDYLAHVGVRLIGERLSTSP